MYTPIFTLPLSGPSPITKMLAGFCGKERYNIDFNNADILNIYREKEHMLSLMVKETEWNASSDATVLHVVCG